MLYGERADDRFPDPLHIEAIADRSAVHSWRIRPHRHHDLFQFFRIVAGGGAAHLDGARVDLPPESAVFMPPRAVHGFDFTEGTDGFVVSVPAATVDRALAAPVRAALARAAPAVLRPRPEAAARLDRLLAEALAEFRERAPCRDAALAAIAAPVALWFARALDGATAPERAATGYEALVGRYADLVEKQFREHAPLEAHAARLGVSVAHLSRACRMVTGRSALALLQDRRLLEARRSLVYTSMTVAEIAFALGFSDPAYFSRFFAARAGVPPSDYRATVFSPGPAPRAAAEAESA
jgi:AraC family transcriptional activator of pobA